MSNCPFCNLDAAPESAEPKPNGAKRWAEGFRRAWRGIQWLFPATLLVFMPKCPMCVIGYVALFTGIGISTTTARWIRILMLTFCLISLIYLAFKHRPVFSKAQ